MDNKNKKLVGSLDQSTKELASPLLQDSHENQKNIDRGANKYTVSETWAMIQEARARNPSIDENSWQDSDQELFQNHYKRKHTCRQFLFQPIIGTCFTGVWLIITIIAVVSIALVVGLVFGLYKSR